MGSTGKVVVRKEGGVAHLIFDNPGRLNALSLAYYQGMDTGSDGVWDVGRVEGPAMMWYFRGAPHVHTWVHIAQKATGV